MIERNHKQLSIRTQAELLSVHRSRLYYEKRRRQSEDVKIARELEILHEIAPFYGYRRMHAALVNGGYSINRKKVRRIARESGLRAIYPKKRSTKSDPKSWKYPYLLSDIEVTQPNQVWAIDITYIKTCVGFVYLAGIIDVYSRKIVGWHLSLFPDTKLCLDALDKALETGTPEIINSDQGCQFTSSRWLSILEKKGIKVSMDGKGRWADNIWIERFWRSLKYECIFLRSLEMIKDAEQAIAHYIEFYNYQRLHQIFGYKTPHAVHSQGLKNNQYHQFQGGLCIRQQHAPSELLQPIAS